MSQTCYENFVEQARKCWGMYNLTSSLRAEDEGSILLISKAATVCDLGPVQTISILSTIFPMIYLNVTFLATFQKVYPLQFYTQFCVSWDPCPVYLPCYSMLAYMIFISHKVQYAMSYTAHSIQLVSKYFTDHLDLKHL